MRLRFAWRVFNEGIRVTTYHGNQGVDTVIPKYKLISTHAGRRSFICNSIAVGIPVNIVIKWTGLVFSFCAVTFSLLITGDKKGRDAVRIPAKPSGAVFVTNGDKSLPHPRWCGLLQTGLSSNRGRGESVAYCSD